MLLYVWQLMQALVSILSSCELEYFSSGDGSTTCLLDEKAWKFIDVRGLQCDGCLMTRTLLTGPAG